MAAKFPWHVYFIKQSLRYKLIFLSTLLPWFTLPLQEQFLVSTDPKRINSVNRSARNDEMLTIAIKATSGLLDNALSLTFSPLMLLTSHSLNTFMFSLLIAVQWGVWGICGGSVNCEPTKSSSWTVSTVSLGLWNDGFTTTPWKTLGTALAELGRCGSFVSSTVHARCPDIFVSSSVHARWGTNLFRWMKAMIYSRNNSSLVKPNSEFCLEVTVSSSWLGISLFPVHYP